MLLFNTPAENLEEKRLELEEEYQRAYNVAKDRQKRKRKYVNIACTEFISRSAIAYVA